MNQPELGKKIIELRKSKGLTQDELVSKCNLNIRTLQRIESGEVTPRVYTLRLIFSALDYDFDNSFVTNTSQGIVAFRLEQFYKYILDLFNLKTNTMKKISILTIILLSVLTGIFIISGKTNAQRKNDNISSLTANHPDEKPSGGLAFSFFECKGCFDDNYEIIGRDIRFKLNGVYVSVGLIKLNQKTAVFKTGYMKGQISKNSIECHIPEEIFSEGISNKEFKFKANTIKRDETKVILEGNSIFTINHENIQDTIMSENISISAF
jgi:transcriptional regulator with XRE-family HTH domain